MPGKAHPIWTVFAAASLGKLTRVDLREIWKNEEYDFSSWLAEEENLTKLSDEIGIAIRLPEKEAGVGKYSLIRRIGYSIGVPQSALFHNAGAL